MAGPRPTDQAVADAFSAVTARGLSATDLAALFGREQAFVDQNLENLRKLGFSVPGITGTGTGITGTGTGTGTWQSQVDQWFRENPNATMAEIQNAAASVGGSFDPTTGSVSYGGQSYVPSNYFTQQEKAVRAGDFDSAIQQWMQDPNAAVAGATRQDWSTYENQRALDDYIDRMLSQGMNANDVTRIMQAYGVTPDALAQMAPHINVGGPNRGLYSSFNTGDQWLQHMIPGISETANFGREWLSNPYEDVAGQGDMYLGMLGRGYGDDFTRQVMSPAPSSLQGVGLNPITAPYFDASDPFNVSAGNQDPATIRRQLSAVLGTTDTATLNLAAQYLYGINLDQQGPVIPPPMVPPRVPRVTGASAPSGSTDYAPGDWTGNPNNASPIPTFGTSFDSPFAGGNWRDTVLAGTGMKGEKAYSYIKNNSGGNDTLSSLTSKLGLNPGEVMAIYEEAVRYARENNLPIPLMPAVTNANKPFYNYGFGPQQRLHERTIGDRSVVNPIAAYLDQIYNQRGSTDEPVVAAATGGYMAGGLTAIHKDPAIKRYMKGGRGGQDDDIPAVLSSGEYVFDADAVAALGDGNPDEGARKLDEMRMNIRRHKRSAPASKIPPKAKNIEQYLKGK
jgi:hypothetical protein